MTTSKPPHDIDSASGCRLPLPKRDDLDGVDKAIFDQLSDPRGGSLAGLHGPGGIRLHSPTVARHTSALNRYLRREAGLSGPIRELAILVTARAWDNQFEWAAHEPQARREGLAAEIIETVRLRRGTDRIPETEAVVIQLGREIFEKHRVGSDTFARALRLFGPRGLVDLVSLMGQYSATAAILTTFDMQLRPGDEPRLPMP